MSPIQLAAILGAVVLVSSMFSVELGVTVALIELTFGVAVGNVFQLHSQDWLDFIAKLASIVLTFLAGMEVDPRYLRDRAKATVTLGVASFAGPFVAASLVSYFLIGWTLKASLIAGTGLSTTSLAVVYAVLVERGLTTSNVGKLLMSATFVTDLCTAIALSAIFIKPNVWFPAFIVVSLALIIALPRIARPFFRRYGDRVIEPEIKLVFVALFVLMVLADASNGHAVLPAFILGLAMSTHYSEHREEQQRLRVVAFAFLTPFFFIKGGLNVSLHAVFANLGLLGVLLLTSKGAAGVTGSGFVVLAATLKVVGDVPVTGIALILGIDRFMSEARALTNVIGNGVATLVVARWTKELDVQQLTAELARGPNLKPEVPEQT